MMLQRSQPLQAQIAATNAASAERHKRHILDVVDRLDEVELEKVSQMLN